MANERAMPADPTLTDRNPRRRRYRKGQEICQEDQFQRQRRTLEGNRSKRERGYQGDTYLPDYHETMVHYNKSFGVLQELFDHRDFVGFVEELHGSRSLNPTQTPSKPLPSAMGSCCFVWLHPVAVDSCDDKGKAVSSSRPRPREDDYRIGVQALLCSDELRRFARYAGLPAVPRAEAVGRTWRQALGAGFGTKAQLRDPEITSGSIISYDYVVMESLMVPLAGASRPDDSGACSVEAAVHGGWMVLTIGDRASCVATVYRWLCRKRLCSMSAWSTLCGCVGSCPYKATCQFPLSWRRRSCASRATSITDHSR
ncbi:hypothetical protein AK812_SmicGene33766 [Symbiodinium microadriaticum]|uniref:Uncharacterized protein n=1 Tax=Symbiodinium microadriaticum TaxID=2951 RepID=A0A1Q9CQQ2_SYMMI|nr:hypothetical protein AK812_SmicGene33766 [Symbiodinium microadriaticum]